MKILLSIILTLVALVLIFLVFIYSGWFNVSAMKQETGIAKWIFNTTMENSVEKRIEDIKVPNLDDLSNLREGFENYNEMCVSCHGAPGKEETELAKGLNPPAPDLAEHAKEMSPQELFWVTKNGIRMTGMPAWGKTHSDEKIWAMVAFMKQLPNITKEEYEKMENETANMQDEHHKHSNESDNIDSHSHDHSHN